MIVTPLAIPDVLLCEPFRHADERGFFSEVWKRSADSAAGMHADWVQDNHSLSRTQGVLRGLHFQLEPMAQAKFVRVVRGRLWDVAVDIRQGIPSYGRHVAAELSAENWRQIFVPRGFAHGFITLEPDTEVIYKVDNEYSREHDRVIRWDDPALGIPWPLPAGGPVLSDKDRHAPLLVEIPPPFPA